MYESADTSSTVVRCRTALPLIFVLALMALAPNESAACHRDNIPHGKDTDCGPPDGGDSGQNTGGGKGGFGELGNACLNLPEMDPSADSGTIANDGVSVYCHGEDGQISVPKRFRIDTKKFNGNDSSYWVNADCGHVWCGGDQELKIFQSQLWYNQDGTLYNPDNVPGDFNGKELNFQEMGVGDVERASMSVAAVDKDYRLVFGKNSGGSVRCQSDTNTGPIWVRCETDSNQDGLCDRWTVSTQDLSGSASSDDARACLKERDVEVAWDVVADFEMDVCVLGGGLAACPDPAWTQ
jgi:hypothetical protein